MIKLAGVITLAVLLSIMLGIIAFLVSSRESRQEEAVTAIGNSWGLQQRLAGPFVVVPVRKRRTISNGVTGVRDEVDYITWLPDRLQVDSRVELDRRKRGIFEAAVYVNHLKLTGTITVPPEEELKSFAEEILWRGASAVFFIADPRGIQGEPAGTWGNQTIELVRGTSYVSFLARGIYTPLRNFLPGANSISFEVDLDLRGTQVFSVAPTAKMTRVRMNSSWPDPSFTGAFLPDKSDISARGFSANWQIGRLAQSLPQIWSSEQQETQKIARALEESYFGVEFLDAVSPYRSVLRSVKYGVLVVTLTFMTFFLFEMLSGLRIHPMQYLSVGAALATFYLLLLSLAEHFGFDWSYLAAAVATVGLICTYSFTVLRGGRRTVVLGGLLSALYAFLYVLMQIEDYALLVGTIALFITLALFMYLTRKVDWYRIGQLSER